MAKNRSVPSLLVVDDESAFRDTLKPILQDEGYAVEIAADGVEAINQLQEKFFDAVLLDVKMPRVDGLEVLAFVRDHYLDTQVIMLTGVDDVRIAVECMKRGAFHYLTKPYSMDELNALLKRALERRQLMIENKVMKTELSRLALSSQLIGQSPAFMRVLEMASKVAPTDSTVLIEGASGTGK
jgi:DNA-binding NtrC family response regulator